MADNLQTLADLAKINDMNARDAGATDIFNAAPLLAALHAIESTNGNSHTYSKYSGAPVVGFRAPNAGRDHDKSGDTLVTLDLQILDASFHVDKKIAEIDKRRGLDGHMAREAMRHLRQGFRKAEEQLFYGLGDDAAGFNGLLDSYAALANSYVIDGGGATAVKQTSVWAIRTVPDESGVAVVLGDGEIRVEEYFLQFVDDATGKKFPAYMQPIDGWVGLQIATANCAARLANVEANLDDDMISDLLNLFEEEAPATHLVMNRQARNLLRKSRTATNPTGAPAPNPEEAFGTPILTTSSIRSNEAVVI